jgi:hyperosmotically inducible periplasmic protein
MPFRSRLRVSLLTASLAITGLSLIALPSVSSALQSPTPAPDNTANNKDHSNTADNQSNSTQDREIAHKIRKAIVADKSLSTYAKNVKVIVKDGAVTLRGPVRSEEEKKQIGDYASQAASAGSVDNELTIQPS